MAGGRVLSIVAQILILPIIARYLTTSEFGAVALAMGIVVLAQLLSDGGLGKSLVRRPDYIAEEWDSVFWLLAGIGTLLSAVLFMTAPLWEALFAMPGLTELIRVLSIIPMIQSLSAVFNAALERDDRFVLLGGLRIVSVILSLGAAIGLATNGFGAWSLVMQQIVLFTTLAIGAVIASPFRPQLRLRPKWLRGHLRFARDTVGTSFVFTLQRQAPIMMLGFVLGAGPLGLYSMALRLLRLPELGLAGPASQVVFVRMARRSSDPAGIGALYLAALRLLALVIVPGMFCLAGFAPELIPLLLTDRWGNVALIFALAAPAFALESTTSMAGMAFLAAGQTTLRLRMATERAILQIATIAIAVPFGINAVAFALSLFAIIYTPRLWWYAGRIAPFPRKKALGAIAWPVLSGILIWLISAMLVSSLENQTAVFLFALAIGMTAIGWVLAALPQLSELRGAIALFRKDEGTVSQVKDST